MSGIFKSIGKLFGGGSDVPKLPPPPPVPTQESAESKAEELKRGKLARLIGGRGRNKSTSILTSPQGVTSQEGTVNVKRLLGE